MKVKTIKATLRAKFDEFVKTIDDEEVRKLVEQNTLITGGSIASMLLREPVNDYDLYFRNKETAVAVAQYYLEVFASHQEEKAKKAAKAAADAAGDPQDAEIQDMLKKRGFKADKSGKIQKIGEKAPKAPRAEGEVKPGTSREFPLELHDRSGITTPVWIEDEGDHVRIVVKSAGVLGTEDGNYQYFEGDPDGDEAAEYIQSVFAGNEFQKLKPGSFLPILISGNAITLSDDVQLVLRFVGEPEEIHKFYDFVHCTNYWTSWDNEVVVNKDALESLLTRELRYIGSQYPICSIIRIRKFLKRGWTINAGQIFKMCVQLSAMVTPQPEGQQWWQPDADNLLLDNTELLQDQLVGVDQAYFHEIISKLKNPPEDGKTVDQTYLFQLIDEVF